MSMDRGIEGCRSDAFVLGQKVVSKLMEVTDTADHGRSRHEVFAIAQHLLEQVGVLRVCFNERVTRMGVVGLRHPAVFAEIIESNDFMAALQQLVNQVPADKTGSSGK